MPTVNHMPFDEGAINDAFITVLGIPTTNKTTKTMCGKRVKIEDANHKADISCGACQMALVKKWQAEKRMRQYDAQLTLHHACQHIDVFSRGGLTPTKADSDAIDILRKAIATL